MNEFEKDELLEKEAEEKEETAADTAEEISEEADLPQEYSLEKELEDIRDMMQAELDKAAGGDDVLIQELEDVSDEPAEDEEELPLCECCEEKPAEEGSVYCEDCINLMKKYPLRKSGIFMTVIMLVVFGISMYLSYPYMEDAFIVADASSNYKAGNTMTALQSYYAYFNGGKKGSAVSRKALSECVDGYLKTGYHSDAATLIGTYFDEKALTLPWNQKYAKAVAEADMLSDTYYAVTEVAGSALNGEDFNYDEVMKALDALKQTSPAEDGTGEAAAKYNEVFIEYYKYIVMSVNEDSLESQFEQLKKIDEIGEGYEWVYLSNYCGIAAKLGDEKAVNESFDRLLEANRQDSTAYISKANYYRYLDKHDAEKIIEICNEASKSVVTNDLSYKHPLAIAYLLKGEGALALEEIKALFDSGAYTLQNCNLYALCALYNGDTKTYDEMKTLLSGYGYEISELVESYKAKKITIEEALKDKGGDI